ncbi:cupin domain-containing protein [Kineobactrum salinum]|uniref:Cupin domain-containing protein n=1 Tax=Kineobactrum salinum TaxID=2708301 RepID=A0A6C0U172_9GAMM|nr:cupin domain-containing protein [Kineobactrum salinum]QIB64075.1 cupin domain-containing protein [Kineobactrum salinum]
MAGLQLDPARFLARYWQREPLLLRAAVKDFRPPISADELAGLAMEADAESRIVEYRASGWHLQQGPFRTADFDRSQPWTLLVQGVDRWLPEVAELARLVDFLPTWRLDDIMVSYASKGGGVGPHYDLYDVFLLQGEGERHWRLGQRCDASTPLLPHRQLKLLADFQCEAEYTLRCGDILYLPPGVAHWGVSAGDSTCFSIGLRAPRITELLSRWVDARLEQASPDHLLEDPGRRPAAAAGEIRREDIDSALSQLRRVLDTADDEAWFGELVTESAIPDALGNENEGLAAALAQLRDSAGVAVLAVGARVAWQRLDDDIRVFVNGNSRRFPATFSGALSELCGHGQLAGAALAGAGGDQLLRYLLEHGGIDVG